MPIELITSATQFAPSLDSPNADRVAEAGQQAEAEGYDAMLIGYMSNRADGWMVAANLLHNTSQIKALLAHRPGIMSPALAARMASTLDMFSNGRLHLNIVTGGSPIDQHREGDYLGHDERYERSIEYVAVMRGCWSSSPFNHHGKYFTVEDVDHAVRPIQHPYIRLYMGGSSEGAMKLAEAHADVFMSWSEPVEAVRSRFADVAARVQSTGRAAPEMSVSMRLIFGNTEDEAWQKADHIVSPDVAEEKARQRRFHSEDVGRNRQLAFAKEGLIHDERLWMGIAAQTGGQGSTGALVGTPDQVTEALLEYVKAGATALLLTGPNGAYEPGPPGFLADLRQEADRVMKERGDAGAGTDGDANLAMATSPGEAEE